jgi:hypothetical protein
MRASFVPTSENNLRISRTIVRRLLPTIGATLTAGLLSATVVLAGGGMSDAAKGHGQAVSEVAKAVDFVSGKAHGEAVSAMAKGHGAAVSAAARAQAASNKGNGQGRGAEQSAEGKAKANSASEPGRLKAESNH